MTMELILLMLCQTKITIGGDQWSEIIWWDCGFWLCIHIWI